MIDPHLSFWSARITGMHDHTRPQPLSPFSLQPCLLSEKRGMLGIGDLGSKTSSSRPAAYCRQQSAGLGRVLSQVRPAGRWNLEQALHRCIMGCGLGRPLSSSSL